MVLLTLFVEFFKIGLFSVGGGLATLPFLYELSDKTGWFTYAQLADMIAVSESTPGPIGVNMATYTGYTCAGVLGSVCATLGLICPSIIVILIIAGILNKFRENYYVNAVFQGLRPASVALIAAVLIKLVLMNLVNLEALQPDHSILTLLSWKNCVLAVFTYFAMKRYKKVHPVIFLLIGAVFGAIFSL